MSDEQPEPNLVPHPYRAIICSGLRSIIASVPFAASLGQAWSEYETFRTTQRIEELFRNLGRRLREQEQMIRQQGRELRGYEDFPELLEVAIERVRREFDEAKRARYAQLLAQLVIGSEARTHDEKIALLESLDTLSEADLQVLFLFKGKDKVEIADLRWTELRLVGDLNNRLGQLTCSLARLESRGLLFTASVYDASVYIQAPYDADTARWVKTKYRLLPLGKSLIAALRD